MGGAVLLSLAKALATRRPAWIARSRARAASLAPLVRDQLAVIVGGAVLAVAVFWFMGDGGRRLRRNWTRWDWVGFVVLGVCALSVLDVIAAHRWGIWQVSTQFHKGAMIEDALWAAGSLDDRPRRPADDRRPRVACKAAATSRGRASTGRSRRSPEA